MYSFELDGDVGDDETIIIDGTTLEENSDGTGEFSNTGTLAETRDSLVTAINASALNVRFTASNGTVDGEVILTEDAGEATGTDLTDITGTASTKEFSVDTGSVAEVVGEYSFNIETAFEDGEQVTFDGVTYVYAAAGGEDFTGADADAQAVSLSAAIGNETRFTDEYVSGNEVVIHEDAGEATGDDPDAPEAEFTP